MGPARGQLSRDQILRAAVALVDRDGLKTLSMRKLGSELGVEAMTLYHYVSGKDEVLDGMVEMVVAEALATLEPGTRWRSALRSYAIGLRRELRARPHMLPLLMTRPAVTSATLEMVESILDLLHRNGFSAEHALAAIRGVTVLVMGNVVDPDDVGEHHPAFDPAAHPTAAAAFAAAARAGPDKQFEFSLDCLLDGYDGRRRTARSTAAPAARKSGR